MLNAKTGMDFFPRTSHVIDDKTGKLTDSQPGAFSRPAPTLSSYAVRLETQL